MTIPSKLREHFYIFLVELLLYQRTCYVFLVTIVKMLVYMVFLLFIDYFTLFLAILRLLVCFGSIWYELNIIDKVDRILDVFSNRGDICGNNKVRLMIDYHCP